MPDRLPERPPAPPADATRDITLPPLPDRPGPAVRPEWATYLPPAPAAQEEPAPPSTGPRSPYDLPTDRLSPSRPVDRSTTLSFTPPPPVQLLKVSVGPSRRSRWLWALAVVVPLLVLVGAGGWLLVLLYGG